MVATTRETDTEVIIIFGAKLVVGATFSVYKYFNKRITMEIDSNTKINTSGYDQMGVMIKAIEVQKRDAIAILEKTDELTKQYIALKTGIGNNIDILA